jgi:hypothetical protein
VTSKAYVDSGLVQKANKSQVGADTLTTAAQTITGAVNELDADVVAIGATIGSVSLSTTAQTVTGAINELDTAVDAINNAGYLTSGDMSGYATTTALDTKQDALTCTNGQMMYFTATGTYACVGVETGSYSEATQQEEPK